MTTPTEVLARLAGLPEHLQAHNRRFIVEAVSDETRAPMIAYDAASDAAREAAQTWAKSHGAEGFYKPSQSWGAGRVTHASVFAFKKESAPTDSAWAKASHRFQCKQGHVALYPSKRPAGKALKAELNELPGFPSYDVAMDHLGLIDTLRTTNGFSSVGTSDGKLHFSVPAIVGDRYFVMAVNHNYDISRAACSASEYLVGEHPEWASDLDYKDDPIAWRPGDGWAFVTQTEFEFIVAEARLAAAREKMAA